MLKEAFRDYKSLKLFSALLLVIILSTVLSTRNHQFIRPSVKIPNKEVIKPARLSFSELKGMSMLKKNGNEIIYKIDIKNSAVRNRKIGFFRVALQKVVEMEDVRVGIYENNIETASIKSNAAMYTGPNDVIFTGNVIFSTHDGKTMKTENLTWSKDEKSLRTEDEYRYTTEDGEVKIGKGFRSDYRLENIIF